MNTTATDFPPGGRNCDKKNQTTDAQPGGDSLSDEWKKTDQRTKRIRKGILVGDFLRGSCRRDRQQRIIFTYSFTNQGEDMPSLQSLAR